MKLTKLFFAAFLLTGTVYAVAAPVHIEKISVSDEVDRHLSGFHAVDVSGSFDVYITQGATESVRVKAPSEVMNRIITEVTGGVLKIYNKNETFHWSDMFGGHRKVVIYVTISNVDAVTLSGSGDVYFRDGLTATSLKLRVSGSGDMTGRIQAKTLDSSVTGSGDMTVTGSAGASSVDVVGSGDYRGRGLVTQSTSVVVTGSGDAAVNATDKVDASVHGSGDISYTGGAKHINTNKTGSGDISRF
jgi:hypothetical protein